MINCKTNVETRLKRLQVYVQEHKLDNTVLAVIQVGDDPASNSYIKGKKRDADIIGIKVSHIKYNESITTEKICEKIQELNNDINVRGIIVQLPIPKHLDKNKIINTITKEKDVDGFRPDSMFLPCTPMGVLSILEDAEYDVRGKTVCIYGQGAVGRPLAQLLIDKRATVISCGSQTPKFELVNYLKSCHVFITAVGKENLINIADFWDFASKEYFFPDVIIDVGINRGSDGKLCGDINKILYDYFDNVTPVPGGVGLYTRVSLLENTVYRK